MVLFSNGRLYGPAPIDAQVLADQNVEAFTRVPLQSARYGARS